MRTTLNIDDQLMALLRKRASKTGRTLTEVVEHALRNEVSGEIPAATSFVLRWDPVPGPALAGIDLSDRDSLYDAMERNG